MLQAFRPRILGSRIFSRAQSSGSLFSEFASPSAPASPPSEGPRDASQYHSNRDLRQHPDIAAKLNPAPKNTRDLLSPLKRELYELNLRQNNGVYQNNQVLTHQNKLYRLNLSAAEQKALEPSVYVQSYRIKGSWKKTYMFLRLFRRLGLNDAISQCHFSTRRMARDVGEMLTRGSENAEKMGLNPENLVIEQIWVGKDGEDHRRLQCKGRGRTGVITSPYVHVKAILKPKEVMDQRQERTKQRLDRKLWFPLTSFKIKEDYVQTANYKW